MPPNTALAAGLADEWPDACCVGEPLKRNVRQLNPWALRDAASRRLTGSKFVGQRRSSYPRDRHWRRPARPLVFLGQTVHCCDQRSTAQRDARPRLKADLLRWESNLAIIPGLVREHYCPRWVPLEALSREQTQVPGYKVHTTESVDRKAGRAGVPAATA